MDWILATAEDPRIAFSVGSVDIHWYSLIIVTAMLLGLLYVCLEIKKIGLTSDDGVELFLWIIPLAIVFARVFYIFPGRIDEYFPWNSWDDFVNAIAIWNGGITIIGGLVGGILGGIFFTLHHRKQTNFLKVADLVVVPLLAGQIVGRLGNFINQEAFGLPITNDAFKTFPFGVYITEPHGVETEFESIVYGNVPGWFCATFFYEMVWNFIGLVVAAIFWHKGKSKKYPGMMIIFYFFWYCLGRFWLEFLRMDAVPVTKYACGIIAPIALLAMVGYYIVMTSRNAYKEVRTLAVNGAISGAALTEKEVKNYRMVGKLLQKGKFFAFIYGKEEYKEVDFEKENYYHVPKSYKADLRAFCKNAEYVRG